MVDRDAPRLNPATEDEIHGYFDRLADALIGADFEAYADSICLPFVITTRADRFVVAEREGLRSSFSTWQRTINVRRATSLHHRVTRIDPHGATGVLVEYVTDLLAGSQRALPAFTNWIYLRRDASGFRAEQLMTALTNRQGDLFLMVDPGHLTLDATGEPDREASG